MGNLENMQAIGDILSYISPIILIVTLKEHKKPTDPGWTTRILELRNHFFAFFGLKILKFFDEDPGSGMETVRIRDGKKSGPWSGYELEEKQYNTTFSPACLSGGGGGGWAV